jgi:hypothetical protein
VELPAELLEGLAVTRGLDPDRGMRSTARAAE